MKQSDSKLNMFLLPVVLGVLAITVALGNRTPSPVNSGPSRPTKEGLVFVKGAKEPSDHKAEFAAFSAGCFWGVEQEFRKQKGVIATAVGFSGGHTKNPSYEQVCSNTTGHAETVRLEYDPKIVSYDKLLSLFWDLHDPTTKDRQGPDFGTQYRSIIFYSTPEQKNQAIASRDKLAASGELKDPIVTEIIPAAPFFKAEEHHQQYVEKGGVAFCHRRKN